jgi:hypothetical protein
VVVSEPVPEGPDDVEPASGLVEPLQAVSTSATARAHPATLPQYVASWRVVVRMASP